MQWERKSEKRKESGRQRRGPRQRSSLTENLSRTCGVMSPSPALWPAGAWAPRRTRAALRISEVESNVPLGFSQTPVSAQPACWGGTWQSRTSQMPVWVEGRMLSRKRGPSSYLQGNLTSPLRETLRKYFFPLAAICLIKMFLDDDKCIVLKVPCFM